MAMGRRVQIEIMQFVDKPGEADNGVAAVILAAFGEGAMLIEDTDGLGRQHI